MLNVRVLFDLFYPGVRCDSCDAREPASAAVVILSAFSDRLLRRQRKGRWLGIRDGIRNYLMTAA